MDIGDIRGKKILDFGCGKGDFYEFLKNKEMEVNYTVNDKLITVASNKYPECKFDVFDIDKEDLSEDFDYIFLCGVFNLKVEGLEQTIKDIIFKTLQALQNCPCLQRAICK